MLLISNTSYSKETGNPFIGQIPVSCNDYNVVSAKMLSKGWELVEKHSTNYINPKVVVETYKNDTIDSPTYMIMLVLDNMYSCLLLINDGADSGI